VHAGREEFLFIWRTLGDPPAHWCDVQIAAALTGMEYPAALGTLVGKLLGHTLPKGETRTDWRRRPLSRQQLDYAINDVLYLHEIHKQLWDRLDELDRRTWYQEEIAQWQTDVVATESQERWRRVSGISGLKSKALAIVRELWRWREEVARSRNRPPKRILRDDLIVELARRGTADVKRIRSVRGFNRGDLKKHMDDIADCIQRALDLPKEDLPGKKGRDVPKQLTVISQFLATALGSVCRRARVAPSITGSVQDMRELVAYLLKMPGWTNLQQPPKLDRGWRADVVGNKIERLLEGRLTIGISDPLSDEPLEFHDAQPEYDEKTPD